jgi:hypothetical protein
MQGQQTNIGRILYNEQLVYFFFSSPHQHKIERKEKNR